MVEAAVATSAPLKARKPRAQPEATRALILDAAERLMVGEGYASVSTRRVAVEAGIKPSLVHYYFRTTDDLLLALYERSAAVTEARLHLAIASDRPLAALWALNMDRERTVLAVEFMALANHRKAIREAIARRVAAFRTLQAEAIAAVPRSLGGDTPDAARGVTVLVAAVARALVMEDALGITDGHGAALAIVEAAIGRLEGSIEHQEP